MFGIKRSKFSTLMIALAATGAVLGCGTRAWARQLPAPQPPVMPDAARRWISVWCGERSSSLK